MTAAELPWLIERNTDGLPSTALIIDLKVVAPVCFSYVSIGSDQLPGKALAAGAAEKLSSFQRKLGPRGLAAIALPHIVTFHPWVCNVFGDLHPTMAADIKGLAECIARGSRGRSPSAAAASGRAASVENRLLVGLSFTRQHLLFNFFEERPSSCV